MIKLDDLRTAHIEGSTFAAYIDEKSILTAGADGYVRVYPGLYDDESLSLSLGSKITCLAVKDKLAVLANDQHEVKSYSLPDMKLENVLLRFTAAVNHICINENRDTIAAGSSDFVIKTVSSDGTNQKTFNGHGAPILSICFVGTQHLVSSSCDGSVKIWNISDQKCIKTLDILSKSNSPSKCPGVMSACFKTKLIAVPSDKSIKIISTTTWKEEFTLEKEHSQSVSNVFWSPCGKYLTSASSSGEVFCWEMSSKTCIKRYLQHQSRGITSLDWKKPKEVLFADDEGEFGFCVMPINEVKKTTTNIELDDDDDEILASAFLEDDEETNDGDIFPSSAAKKGKKRSLPVDDDDDDNIDEEEINEDGMPSSKRTRINNMDNFLDDQAEDSDDDEASISLNLIKEGLMEPIRKSVIDDEDNESITNFVVEDDKVKKQQPVADVEVFMQPPFQPSSTPVHLQHRFMAWNAIGIIRCHRDEGVSSIDVEFHNASTSHPLHIANVLDNSMAALSGTAVVFACKKQDDMPSKLTCMHFGSWDSDKEWSIPMPDGEDIMAISANTSQITIATSKRLLRVLSVGGLQTQLLHLPGPIVSMAMHEKEMTVVYHKSAGYKKCQCLGVMQYQYKKRNWKLCLDYTLNLQSDVTVVWLGYSSEGTPAIVLSSGDVLLYHRNQQSWILIGNTKQQVKNKSDNYWIIGIDERQARMSCIYCKGANIPALLPRPMPTFIPFQIPLCEMKTEKSIKEHELIKNKLLSSNMSYSQGVLRLPIDDITDASEKQQIQLLMQLFALACKSDRGFRAIEICKLMPSADSIGLAIQYASKMRRMNIAKKLTELAQAKAAEEEDNEEDEEGEEVLSDGEQDEVSEDEHELSDKENNARIIAPLNRRTRTKNLGNSRSHSHTTRPESLEVDDDEEEENEEEDQEEEDNSEELFKASQNSIENSAPKLKLSGNPFKVSQQNTSLQKSGGAKGTGYFEKLESQKLQKIKLAQKNINAAAKKKTNKIQSKTAIKRDKKKSDSNGIVDFNVVKKDNKPLTGFQLFLNHQQKTSTETGDEFVPIAMKMWKDLSSDDKKTWNNKAKDQQQQASEQCKQTKDNNNATTAKGTIDERKKLEPKTTSVKSKLSSFAFHKS